ncbi:bifunctional RNase H/acid phosphatase [Cellulomonas fimi]|uniref:Phosphoglycerate mutase n=1 Tax=Cellulomonas fimi (strain ATCC 484 / DSM 20113 / JCM 1341 / CCUG 24087 / LMG 16345 / NBRC 15513 / NCIMB 8980 / NCTC 7547 / NRS-133) TaxID=590998 RepID=F4H287_CELFA|nr:bifunctional RNase H/acid phosphatase [Cellulomonas fimi]AEE46384.1 Phosphoglycerate mutase [Cellulomonas fimi ATCC 484]VEH32781.1 bifunctional RNase H/acid phosphatase [Cellulomonas fimi]
MARRLVVEADGGSRGNPGPAGYGAVVRDAGTGDVLAERADFLGVASNNVAEYSGLVAGLRAALAIDPDARLEVRMDSQLVIEQMRGTWKIKHADMRRFADEVHALVDPTTVTWTWVPRARNAAADRLANLAMDRETAVMTDHDDVGPLSAPTTDPAGSGTQSASAAGDPGSGRAPRPSGAGVRFDDDQPVTVVLVRHGQTAMTVSRGYSGSSEPGPSLDDTGRAQARAAAALVDRVGRDLWGDIEYPSEVLASPMVRTQETAAVVAERLGLPVRTVDLVKEADFGEWQGLTAEQIEERWPGLLEPWHTAGDLRPPGGESIADVGERLTQVFEQLLDGGTGRTVVVVSHAVAIRAALGVAMGAQPGSWSQLRVAPASVSIVRLFRDKRHEIAVVGVPSEGWGAKG